MAKYDVAYAVYNQYDQVVGIALSQAEAAYQVWQLFMEDLEEDDIQKMLETYDYESLEDMENDWYEGLFGWEIENFYYEEYQVFNDLGID